MGGDPGIGKSTLLLQVCRNLSMAGKKVLYISGEESLKQIKMRANRIGTITGELLFLCETNLDLVRGAIENEKPDVVIIDSIQTMYREDISSAPGSVSQVRESTNLLMQTAKGLGLSLIHIYYQTMFGLLYADYMDEEKRPQMEVLLDDICWIFEKILDTRNEDGTRTVSYTHLDTCRLWDKETHEKLDKDRFRRDMGNVEDAYNEVFRRLGIEDRK